MAVDEHFSLMESHMPLNIQPQAPLYHLALVSYRGTMHVFASIHAQ